MVFQNQITAGFIFLGEKSNQRTSGSSHFKNPKQTMDFMKELVVNKAIILLFFKFLEKLRLIKKIGSLISENHGYEP
jgi:hypothetical protein